MQVEPDNIKLSECLALFSKYQRKLFSYIFSLVGNANDTEEVLHEVNIVVWQKFEDFEPGTDFQAWVFQITYLQIRKHWQRKRREGLMLSLEVMDQLANDYRSREQELDSRREALPQCIDKLPEKDRQLVDQVYTASVSVEELARRLNRHKQSIYRSLGRIRQLLLECIKVTTARMDA